MNAKSPAFRALIWKEARQAAVLAVAGIAMVVVLLLAWLPLPEVAQRNLSLTYLPLILPCLFAIGVGTILVSQEKLTGTLDWFNTIPISPSRVITAKLIVAMAGLIVMWVLCAISYVPLSWLYITPSKIDWSTMSATFCYSVLFVLCGFYAAWRFENSFTCLILGVVLAFLPLIAITFLEELRWIRPSYGNYSWWQVVLAIAISPIMVYLLYRAGLRRLAPRAAPRPPSELDSANTRNELSFDAWHPPQPVASFAEPFRYRLTSLIWQSIHHNRKVLLGLGAVIVIGMTLFPIASSSTGRRQDQGALVSVMIVSVLSVSWLGVIAHHGDGSSNRMRFLAERGVSPTKAWFGLHLIGLSIIAAACTGYFIVLKTSAPNLDGGKLPLPSISFLLVFLLIAYGVSQATSQAIRIMAASFLIAPILSILAIGWLAQFGPMYGSPLWILLLTGLLPLALTWWCMGDHMDGRRGLRFWVKFAVVIALFSTLPFAPPYLQHLRFPKASADELAAIQAEVAALPKSRPRLSSITRASTVEDRLELDVANELSGEQAAEILRNQSTAPEYWIELNGSDDQPLRAELNLVVLAIGTMNLHAMKLAEDPTDQRLLETYGDWVKLVNTLARRLRMSHRLYDQNVADLAEIELLATLSEPELKEFLAEDFSAKAINRIADRDSRNRARRHAVLSSWRKDQPVTEEGKLLFHGSFSVSNWFEYLPPGRRQWLAPDQNTLLVQYLLSLLEAGSDGSDRNAIEPTLRKIHVYLLGPDRPFEIGPYSPRFRAGNVTDRVASHNTVLRFPGSQWFAPWEENAVQLAQTIQEAK